MARAMRKPGRRATVLVEAALVMPFILLILFGVIGYGWIFLQKQHITQAARHGVRIGIPAGATSAEVQAGIADWMLLAGLAGSGYQVTILPADVSVLNLGETLTVSVSVPFANTNLDINIPFVPMPATLEASVSMAKEGL